MGQNMEKAAKKGALAFLRGKKKGEDCPYPAGSKSKKAYDLGYDEQKRAAM